MHDIYTSLEPSTLPSSRSSLFCESSAAAASLFYESSFGGEVFYLGQRYIQEPARLAALLVGVGLNCICTASNNVLHKALTVVIIVIHLRIYNNFYEFVE
jgi:hypothetical protein